jgi:DNA repair exonuclease SbcCD ATPase subunit
MTELLALAERLEALDVNDRYMTQTMAECAAALREAHEVEQTLRSHFDLAPKRYAAAKAALPEVTRCMRCPICNTEFADGVLHDTGLALINTYDRMTKAEAEVERLTALAESRRLALDARTPELCELTAEVERLQSELTSTQADARTLSADNERLRALLVEAFQHMDCTSEASRDCMARIHAEVGEKHD